MSFPTDAFRRSVLQSRTPARRAERSGGGSIWRRWNWARRRAQTVADVMPAVLNRLGLDRRRARPNIVRVWNNLIDPNLTAHAGRPAAQRHAVRHRGQQCMA